MTFSRQTVAAEVSIEGVGLHSGIPVTVTMRPSESGIVFRFGKEQWEAIPQNVTDTRLCTRLGGISTVEHLMSALAGLEITDVDIECSTPEMPALDGSSKPFVEALQQAGFTLLRECRLPNPFSRIFVHEDEAKIAISAGTGHWRYVFDTGTRWPGEQVYESTDLLTDYTSNIAPARTFGFEEQIPGILAAGLAKGLDLSTALVLGLEGYKNEPLFPDEPARHKLLDAAGDLYLAGVPLRFLNIVAERTGHTANVKAAGLLYQAVHHG